MQATFWGSGGEDVVSKQQARDLFASAAESAFDELQAWCEAHPKYTLMELEEQARAIRQRLMGTALSSFVAQRESGQPPDGVFCPKCGAKTEDKGQQSRTVQGPEGPVTLTRAYRYCPSCKEGFFPPRSGIAVDETALD